jgi:iron-sulfur cluster assembly 1
MIKIGLKTKGCSGLAYHLEYVKEMKPYDEMVENDGVKIVVDSDAILSIIGSTMDYSENELASQFTFDNPNAKDRCGCGQSFSV